MRTHILVSTGCKLIRLELVQVLEGQMRTNFTRRFDSKHDHTVNASKVLEPCRYGKTGGTRRHWLMRPCPWSDRPRRPTREDWNLVKSSQHRTQMGPAEAPILSTTPTDNFCLSAPTISYQCRHKFQNRAIDKNIFIKKVVTTATALLPSGHGPTDKHFFR